MRRHPLLPTLLALACCALSSTAAAADPYVAGSYLLVAPAHARDGSFGSGFALVYGLPLKGQSALEFSVGGHALRRQSDLQYDVNYQLAGTWRYALPSRHGLSPFLLGGLGAAFEDERNQQNVRPFADVGAGLSAPLGLSNLRLRAEGRYHNVYARNNGSSRTYGDGQFHLGLELPLARPKVAENAIDSDGDGVVNSRDNCLNTLPGTEVDGHGCPLLLADSDGDGVADSKDLCPGTAPASAVNLDGCVPALAAAALPLAPLAPLAALTPAAPTAASPAPIAAAITAPVAPPVPVEAPPPAAIPPAAPTPVVDVATAPPVLIDPVPTPAPPAPVTPVAKDTDNDGIANEQDQCGNTVRGMATGPDGCWVAQTTVLAGLEFESSSTRLTASAKDLLKQLADNLKTQPSLRLEISGHTDSLGPQAANLDLSLNRAKAVASYLEAQGIDSARLTAEGYGEFIPIASNDNEAGRSKNRRIELKVLPPVP